MTSPGSCQHQADTFDNSIQRQRLFPFWSGGVAILFLAFGLELLPPFGAEPSTLYPLLMLGAVLSAHWLGLWGGIFSSGVLSAYTLYKILVISDAITLQGALSLNLLGTIAAALLIGVRQDNHFSEPLNQAVGDLQVSNLQGSEAMLLGILDIANDPIISVDASQRINQFNKGAEKVFGYQADEVLGQSLDLLLPKRAISIHHKHIQKFGASRSTARMMGDRSEVFGRRKDGTEFPAEASISQLQLGDEKVFTAILRDSSDRKRAETELQQAKEAAEVANQAKSGFLANMSHELRTPLNAILGFSQLMHRDPALTSAQKEHLDIINRSGEHLLELINDILEMSKIEAGRVTLHKTNFDLYNLLETLIQMLDLRAKTKGLQLTCDRAPDTPQFIRADEGKLRQVLINLLGNAIKFTESGHINLRVHAGPIQAQAASEAPQLCLFFEIEDTGSGIDPSEIKQLFAAFTQTETGRKSQQGTGLGLPISHRFVKLMGGDLTVKSVVGQGTTFQFYLQVTLGNEVDHKPQPMAQRVIGLAPDQPAYRILIVEDRMENRKLMVNLLQPLGFEVREAENGKVAIEECDRWRPHLIWMDMRMPVMDGYEATQYIKAHIKGQATVIIALTASALDEERAQILATGCDDFVRKPFLEDTIFEKMTEYLGVRYIFEKPQPLSPQPAMEVTASQLSVMPTEWLAELHQAAMSARSTRIETLIQEIPEEHSILAEGLTDLVSNFNYEKILTLTQP